MVSFERLDFKLFSAILTSPGYAENFPIVLDDASLLIWEGSIWRSESTDYTSFTEEQAGIAGINADFVIFLNMTSGNVWVGYGNDKTRESDDYGETWGAEVTVAGIAVILDMFKIGTDAFIFARDATPNYEVYKWNSVGGSWDIQDSLAFTNSMGAGTAHGIVIGTTYYTISNDDPAGVGGGYVFKYVNGTTTLSREAIIDEDWEPVGEGQNGILMNSSDTSIWYVVMKSGADYRVYKTTDTGATWTQTFLGEDFVFIPQIYQLSDDDVWCYQKVGGWDNIKFWNIYLFKISFILF